MPWWDNILGGNPRDRFAQQLMSELARAGDTRLAEYDPAEFRLVFRDSSGEQGVLNLSNLFAEYTAANKSDRPRCMKAMVRAALSHMKPMPDVFDEAAYDLRPRLWTRSTFEHLRYQSILNDEAGLDWPLEDVGEHLQLSLVYDLPESVRSISMEDLNRWEKTYWEARERAVENLAEVEVVYARLGDDLYVTDTGDTYDGTRLIMLDFIRELEVPGRPLAMVPNRDTLIVTGTESIEGQEQMLAIAAMEMQHKPRPMVGSPLILAADNQWEDYQVPDVHPLSADYHELRMAWLGAEYEQQREMLARINEKQRNDIFVASYSMLEKDGRRFSYCVWGGEYISWLPETDLVALMETEQSQPRLVRFAELKERCPHLLRELEYYPRRFEVVDFPQTGVRESLRDFAV